MKKIILILSIFIIGLSIFAQEQSVKIYLNDGSEKIYNISDINNFRTIKAFQNLFMKIYFKDSTIEAFSASGVDSMLFNNNKIQVYTFGCMNEYEIVSIDSIIYSQNSETVRICDQVWMTRNLDVDHYRNGDSITQVTNPIEWHSLTTGAWCYYNHSDSLGRIYGKLYNLDAVNDTRGLAPQGWHIPSDVELTTLTNYLGGESVAGGKLKETGAAHWPSITLATNESGFTCLPGGQRNDQGDFYSLGYYIFLWSNTIHLDTYAWIRRIHYYERLAGRYYFYKNFGHSVRCIKD